MQSIQLDALYHLYILNNILNNHFVGSVRSLAEAGGCSQHVLDYNSLEDPIENVVQRFKHHPSIIAIDNKKFENIFEFQFVDLEEVTSEINKLDKIKTTGVSIKMLQDNVDICAPILMEIFNNCTKNGAFADEFKLADII